MAAPIRFEILNTIPTSGIRSISEATKPKTVWGAGLCQKGDRQSRSVRRTSVGDFSLSHPELNLRRAVIRKASTRVDLTR